jgi:hypothetical protein
LSRKALYKRKEKNEKLGAEVANAPAENCLQKINASISSCEIYEEATKLAPKNNYLQ